MTTLRCPLRPSSTLMIRLSAARRLMSSMRRPKKNNIGIERNTNKSWISPTKISWTSRKSTQYSWQGTKSLRRGPFLTGRRAGILIWQGPRLHGTPRWKPLGARTWLRQETSTFRSTNWLSGVPIMVLRGISPTADSFPTIRFITLNMTCARPILLVWLKFT